MQISFKIYKILLASILLCYSANGQNLQKQYAEAYKLYEKKDYLNAEEICGQILSTDLKSVKNITDIWSNHSAAYLMFCIYHDSTYVNYSSEVSKTYLDVSKVYLELLISKDPKLENIYQPRIKMIDSIASAFSLINESNIVTSDNKNNIKVSPKETPISAKTSSSVVLVIAEGQGITKDLAVNNALRSAIEKTFGAFISSNSKVSNDSLIKDEVVSISNGNILNYEIISQVEKNGLFLVTLSANISPENIVINAKKSGSTFELNGGVYYQNILKEEFYKKQESIVLKNFFEQWQSVKLFDYKVNELDMYRYVAQTFGEFWMPRVSMYLDNFTWTYYKKDIYKYQNDKFYPLIQSSDGDGWDYLPKEFMGVELFQIPYKISINPNENYFKFIRAYADVLFALSIKNITNYKDKYGEPLIMWDLVYPNLVNSINVRSKYSIPVSTDSYGISHQNKTIFDGQIAFRNPESIKLMHEINGWVKSQDNCRNLYVYGIEKGTIPPAFWEGSTFDVSKRFFKIDEFPYPHDSTTFNSIVYLLLSFTKEELAKFNSKIILSF